MHQNNNFKFYQNNKCEYFPCHKCVKDFNCKFCFCPLYQYENCGGNYTLINGSIKDCSNCTIIHQGEEGYDYVIKKLEEFSKK